MQRWGAGWVALAASSEAGRTRTAFSECLAGEDGAREKFAVLALVEPRALEIEERDAGQVRERERIEGELGERLPGGRVGFVVEDVNCAVADLQEVDMAGD